MSFSILENIDNTIEGIWTVDPTYTAEHLSTFDVRCRRDALAVLRALGHAFEAGGGAWQ